MNIKKPQCKCNHNGCIHHQIMQSNKENTQTNKKINTKINNGNIKIKNPLPKNPFNIIDKIKTLGNKNNKSIIKRERIKETIIKLAENAGQPGIDAIPIDYYFWSGNIMTEMLYDYYNILEKINIFPANMKTDIKTPLPKYKANANDEIKLDPSQYRPIACQNIIYKILDGNLKIELEEHDKKHNIIEINQGGFKKEQGTNEHTYVLQNIFCYNPKFTEGI